MSHYLRRPPDVKRPGAERRPGLKGGSLGRRADDKNSTEPEFGTSRRAFLIYPFTCGLVRSERVVERIAAELETQAPE